LLGVFIEKIVPGAVIKALRRGSGCELALTARPIGGSSSPFLVGCAGIKALRCAASLRRRTKRFRPRALGKKKSVR
jgi:hypothetical protein